MFGGGFGMQQQPQFQNKNNDHIVQNSPTDTVSSITFSPSNNLFACGSWSKEMFIYEIGNQGAVFRTKLNHGASVLTTSFMSDGMTAFSGGTDNNVKMWALASGQSSTIAQHQSAVKECAYIPEINVLATASWDKTLKFWDTRQSNPVAQHQLSERAYSMDVKHPVLILGTADRKFSVFDLTKGSLWKTIDSPLKYQIRDVSIFPDKTGFAAGSVEGRVAVAYLNDREKEKNFAFKCHRDNSDVFSVNCLDFHPYGTFATAGSDGIYTFWDKDAKQRLKGFEKAPVPITAASFNPQGSIYAYALGYDWHRGIEMWDKYKQTNMVLLHKVEEPEIQKKKPGAK